ncbi:hypothetical protein GCM10010495_55930 [Kitasatospora herbaricolor]|uniref:hypothetical protein n=1 Tax=Kitasatospora herbaricolor TaxID=68217 RepID=UPI00174AD2C3|nr:hypothetical protein [Kitasatospora herbaricolor]MDQ0310999.1 hypothetical protein [Kitasatospora herbaricolor]GGV32052.1 hypothetical protein GCM10010495_55930 [Kitasatospora herbaricolor]
MLEEPLEQWDEDIPLELDTGALEERAGDSEAEDIDLDDEAVLLARRSRLALRALPSVWVEHTPPPQTLVDLSLRCAFHRHPDVKLAWVRLTVDLPEDGTVLDLSPDGEIADRPVHIVTRYGGGLSLQTELVPLAPEVAAERVREQDVFLPGLTVSGREFSYAQWDFLQQGETPLHVDRNLRALVALPAGTAELPLTVTLRAKVTVGGLLGTVPLLGKRRIVRMASGIVKP